MIIIKALIYNYTSKEIYNICKCLSKYVSKHKLTYFKRHLIILFYNNKIYTKNPYNIKFYLNYLSEGESDKMTML